MSARRGTQTSHGPSVARSGLGAGDAPSAEALVAVVQHGGLAGAGAQTDSAVSTTNRSLPTIVTSASTSAARWRIRTDASKRSRGGSPAVKRAPSTLNVRWATRRGGR